MSINKYNFKKGEKVVFVDNQEGTVECIYVKLDFKETNNYYLEIETQRGDTWTFVCNDDIKEEQFKKSDFYKIVHKVGNRVFGKLLTSQQIEEIENQIKQDNLNNEIHYVEGKHCKT